MSAPAESGLLSRQLSIQVFVNPSAGRGRARAYVPRSRDLFQALNISAQFVDARSAPELESLARQALAQGKRMLLAMGGDGTFQALANAVFGSDAIIGILPTGGGNDFAAALGLPRHPVRAAELLLKGNPRFVDLVRAQTADGRTRLYAGGGGLGLDAEAALLATGPYRHLPGRLRYIASALRALSEHRPLKVRLEFPDAGFDPTEVKCLLTGALNTPTYGGGMRLAPGARIDDGFLQLVCIEELRKLDVLRLLPRLLRTGDLRTSRVKRWKVKRVRICADRPCLFHGDGEIFGPAPVDIEVLPNAVRVLAPSSAKQIA